jgi:hypothetical protein
MDENMKKEMKTFLGNMVANSSILQQVSKMTRLCNI